MSQPFPFLLLPPELREKIYLLLITPPSPSQSHISLSHPTNFPLSLLLTSHQIYHELRPLYFTHNSFTFTISRPHHNSSWTYILSPAFKDNLRAIGRLRIVVLRWGKGDFWEREVVKWLEDAVLVGRLRRLVICVKEGVVEGWRKYGMGKEREPWRSLRRLLKDPYLEEAGLLAGDEEVLAAMGDVDGQDGGHGDEKENGKGLRDVTWLLD